MALAPAAAACAAVVTFSPPSTSITGCETPLGADRPQAPDLGQHFGQEGLAAEARIHGHHQDNVAEMQDMFDELQRARRIQHHAWLLSEISDLGQRPMQVDRGARLGLDEQVIRPRLGEGIKVALRLDDHEMHIERLRSATAGWPATRPARS